MPTIGGSAPVTVLMVSVRIVRAVFQRPVIVSAVSIVDVFTVKFARNPAFVIIDEAVALVAAGNVMVIVSFTE